MLAFASNSQLFWLEQRGGEALQHLIGAAYYLLNLLHKSCVVLFIEEEAKWERVGGCGIAEGVLLVGVRRAEWIWIIGHTGKR